MSNSSVSTESSMGDTIEAWLKAKEDKATYRRDEETLRLLALVRVYRAEGPDAEEKAKEIIK